MYFSFFFAVSVTRWWETKTAWDCVNAPVSCTAQKTLSPPFKMAICPFGGSSRQTCRPTKRPGGVSIMCVNGALVRGTRWAWTAAAVRTCGAPDNTDPGSRHQSRKLPAEQRPVLSPLFVCSGRVSRARETSRIPYITIYLWYNLLRILQSPDAILRPLVLNTTVEFLSNRISASLCCQVSIKSASAQQTARSLLR